MTTITMTTYTNLTGSKSVNITLNNGRVLAMYVQNYKGEQQVLQSKSFAKFSTAKKWADKILFS